MNFEPAEEIKPAQYKIEDITSQCQISPRITNYWVYRYGNIVAVRVGQQTSATTEVNETLIKFPNNYKPVVLSTTRLITNNAFDATSKHPYILIWGEHQICFRESGINIGNTSGIFWVLVDID